jgi:hypothetical protein
MSVPKKSLISNRMAVKKAIIASAPADGAEFTASGSLKASAASALSMKSKRALTYKAYKSQVAKKA